MFHVKQPTEKQKTGKIGENIAETFLVKRGFETVALNYLKKVGEIDIISRKGGKIYFVEVKTVSRETVSRETDDVFRAEDNIHAAKIMRMNRAIQIYIEETAYEGDWEIIAVLVELNTLSKTAKVKLLEDFAW